MIPLNQLPNLFLERAQKENRTNDNGLFFGYGRLLTYCDKRDQTCGVYRFSVAYKHEFFGYLDVLDNGEVSISINVKNIEEWLAVFDYAMRVLTEMYQYVING